MHQLEIQGGRTATLTRVRFTGGVMVFSEDHTRYLRELEERLMMVLKLSIFTVAQILREVHKQKLYLIDNDNLGPAADGEYQTPDTEKVAFEKWAKRRGLGHTYSYLMKWIKVGELYDDQQQFFDSREELPTRERLIFLAQHRDHPEMPRLLEASVGTPVDWKATVNEVIEQKEPDQAQEEAEAEVEQTRQRIAAHRTPLNRCPHWESEEFRLWVRQQPCIFTGTQDFQRVDPAHIHSRGAGHDDFRNVVPLRNHLHQFAHDRGWGELLERYGKDREWLYAEADRVLIGWLNRSEHAKTRISTV